MSRQLVVKRFTLVFQEVVKVHVFKSIQIIYLHIFLFKKKSNISFQFGLFG